MSSSGPASSDGSGSRQQVAALQTRIRELERQVQKGAGSAHNGVSTTSTLNSFSGISIYVVVIMSNYVL